MVSGSMGGEIAPRPALGQFVKFCIVGGSSFAIDSALLFLLHKGFGVPLAPAETIAFFIAVGNGFYWNRKWTFKDRAGDAKSQYPKFLATNLVGWALNLTIMTAILIAASRIGWIGVRESAMETIRIIAMGQGKDVFPSWAIFLAKCVATVFVTAWNFTASRLWTFRPAPVETRAPSPP